jgi:hypothetical protein
MSSSKCFAVLQRCCISSKGKLRVLGGGKNYRAFIFVEEGEPITFCDWKKADNRLLIFHKSRFLQTDELAVDRYDNLYVIAQQWFWLRSCSDFRKFRLYIRSCVYVLSVHFRFKWHCEMQKKVRQLSKMGMW